MPPTISADDSVASGASGRSDAFSVDGASYNESTKGTSIKASSVKAEYVFLNGEECCLTEFYVKGSDVKLVCGNTNPCGRHGHKEMAAKPGGKGLEGFYKPKPNQRFLDGVAETRMSIEEYETKVVSDRDANRAAVNHLTAGGGTTADYGVEEDMDLKLPAFDVTPDRITVSSKMETLMSEDMSDGEEDEDDDDHPVDWSIPLQGDWAKVSRDGGILKNTSKPPPTVKKANLKTPPAAPPTTTTNVDMTEALATVMSALLEQSNGIRQGLDGLLISMNDLKLQGRANQVTLAEEIAKAQVKAATAVESAKATKVTNQRPQSVEGYYAVAKGRRTGVFTTSAACKAQVDGFSGSISQKFSTHQAAKDFIALYEGVLQADGERAGLGDEGTGAYYAVASGRVPGIYTTPGEAEAQVLGFSGSSWKKFNNRREAQTYIDLYNQVKEDLAEKKAASKPDETNQAATGTQPDIPTTTTDSDFRMSGEKEFPTLDAPPPVPHFLASDPSIGQKRVVFGHQVGSEQQLRESLSPTGLIPSDQKDLAACMIDAVAAPGRSNILESEGTSGVEDFTEALKELSNGRDGQQNSAVREDSQWRSVSRNSLRSARTEESLQDLFDVTQTLRPENLGNMNTVMGTVFDKYYWDSNIKQYWSQGNLFFRISADSLDNFLALLTELLRVSRQYGWQYAQTSVNFHSKKLTEIRGTAISRLNCLVDIYIYLRDSRIGHFNAPGLQEKRNIFLFNEMTKVEKALGVATSPKCPKCGGSSQVHPAGRANCPFKALKDVVARQRAAAIMEAYQQDSNREE